jgi:hypothetical protein
MFHWICPECGREIPPSVRECQACDPNAVAPVAVEPVEFTPVAEVSSAPPPIPETVAETPRPALLVAPEPLLLLAAAPVADLTPAAAEVALVAEPLVETATTPIAFADIEATPATELAVEDAEALVAITPEPVAEELPLVEETPVPEPVLETVAAEVEPAPPVAEPPAITPEPVVAVQPEAPPAAEPVLETAPQPQVAPEPAVATQPVVEAPPVPEPVLETAAEPVAATLPVVEAPPVPEPVLETPAIAAEPQVAPEPVAATQPVVETTPVPEPVPETAANAAEPVVELAAVTPEPVPEKLSAPVAEAAPAVRDSEPQIQLREVPDPLLALAEEIRAAQTARAAAIAAPPDSTGLRELAGAVGLQQQSPVSPEPAHYAGPAARSVQPSTPEKISVAAEAAEIAEVATAVALLAPPQPEIAPEPVGIPEMRPVALAPESQPAAEPEPFVLAEPQEQPAALAPELQPEGPTLPLAPMQDYTPATRRSIMPVPPRIQILGADSGPRITLPGPTLPPELTRLQDAKVVNVMGEDTAQRAKEAIAPAKSGGAPGWLVSTLVMVLLLAAGLGVVFYLLPHTVADAKPSPTPAVAATAPAPTGGSSPLAKFVEVTGFRIITSTVDANKKSEVQYLIVNHSDADISDANVFVTLRSAKPGQPPVCRFSFKVPSLGPFESKEMSSPIEKATHAISLPDWQEMRAEVQISQ